MTSRVCRFSSASRASALLFISTLSIASWPLASLGIPPSDSALIDSPKDGQWFFNASTLPLHVDVISYYLPIQAVQYRLENANGVGDYRGATFVSGLNNWTGSFDGLASATNSWTGTVDGIAAGTNTLRVQVWDSNTNLVAGATIRFANLVFSQSTVSHTGKGIVTKHFNPRKVVVGLNYYLAAKGTGGYVFSSWSGSVTSDVAQLSFTMQSNAVIVANFVPFQFGESAGRYQAAFTNSPSSSPPAPGWMKITVAKNGNLHGIVDMYGYKIPISGQFDASGACACFANGIGVVFRVTPDGQLMGQIPDSPNVVMTRESR